MTTSLPAHAVAPGDLVDGRYRVVELIGEGGMGAVFLAEHVGLSKEVALKVIHPSFAGNGEIRARFEREAMASARVEHPNVASALDIGELPDGSAYLVMPLVRGPSLAEVLSAGPMPEMRAIEIGAQIADALAAAHAAGIVHRDLKPDNVVLVPRDDGGDHVKVLDFGIAGLSGEVEGPSKALTRVGTVMGTPGYMSPEQAIGEPVDARTDLYALGVILWEALTGRALFDGGDVAAIVTQQLTTTPPSPNEAGARASLALDALVVRLLSRSRDDRPSTAVEVRDALLAMLPETRPSWVGGTTTGVAVPRAALPTIPSGSAPLVTSLRARARQLTARFRAMPRRAQAIGSAVFAALLLVLALTVGDRADDEEVAEVAPSAAAKKAEKKPAASKKGEVDAALVEQLTEGSTRSERLEAARALDASGVTLPAYVRAMVDMELAKGCADRRAALEAIAELRDARTRDFIERWGAMPKRGCGFMKARDCYACIRDDLDRTKAALE